MAPTTSPAALQGRTRRRHFCHLALRDHLPDRLVRRGGTPATRLVGPPPPMATPPQRPVESQVWRIDRPSTATTRLPTSTPSAQGVDALGLLALVDGLEAGGHDPHSLVVARHGHVIARGWWAPYAPERVQLVYSLSKSFTATAVGLLVDEGRLSLDQPVLDLLPAGRPAAGVEVSDRYRRLTLGHCLTMATGHDGEGWVSSVTEAAHEAAADGDADPVLAAILATPQEHEPGTAWAYNQIATYLAAGRCGE